MPLTWGLVATIVREADNGAGSEISFLPVLGDQVLLTVRRVGANTFELWRSDDRGVTWAFHVIPGYTALHGITGLLVESAFIWVQNQTLVVVTRTPRGNPGAGGFADFAVAFTGAYAQGIQGATTQYWHGSGGSVNIMRIDNLPEPPANPIIGNDGPDGSNFYIVRIPDTANDALFANRPAAVESVRRITLSMPRVIVNSVNFAPATIADGMAALPLAALSSADYWCSTNQDVEPASLQQSVNGGVAWTARNLAAGFWSDVPGVGGNQRKGSGNAYIRFGGSDYCIVIYVDGANPAQTREHARIAKFDPVTNTWLSESDRANDGFAMRYAVSGQNAAGGIDFYVGTYDPATDTTRIYRATQEAPGGAGVGTLRHGVGRFRRRQRRLVPS